MKIFYSLWLLFLLNIGLALGQPSGTLDSSFNQTGIFMYDFGFHDNINDIKVQPNQKIIITGVEITPAFAGILKVMRLNTDGTLDPSFATNGIYSMPLGNESYGYRSVVTQEGKIIVAGITYDATYQADWLLFRLDSTGVLDSSFGNNGITIVDFFNRDDLACGMALQPDGKIVVAGSFTDTVNFYNNPCIMRFTSDGMIDSTYGSNGYTFIPGVDIDNRFYNVAVKPNGKIVACGHYSKVFTGAQDFDVLVFCTDSVGNNDPMFGVNGAVIQSINGGIDDVFGLDYDADGNIFVAGYTTLPVTLDKDIILVKYDSIGVPVSSFGSSGIVSFNHDEFDVAMEVKIQPDSKILVGGSSGLSFFGARNFAILRYLNNGNPDPTFGNNGFVSTAILPDFQDCNALTLQDDGKIVAAGKTYNGVNNDMAVVRYHNDIGTFIHQNNTQAFGMTLFPNPVIKGGVINLLSTFNTGEKINIALFNVMGEKIFEYQLPESGNDRYSINIPATVPSGVYVLNVTSEQFHASNKITIK
jgi:uncharacterized delta-60 repeat protein